ncbi:transposase [uncultured Desulfobacter sp.]|uniref:transposase n=1 Tax=uncultured Desulfobacter sp. TaxID=240139 RepID=UPI002AAAE7AD|nr:transposase [uncultured Desulfobacter sp.]
MMEVIEMFQKQIEQINVRLEMLTRDHANLLERLDEVPGIDKQSAQSILGETGVTLDEFESMVAFVAWAGLCPGNNKAQVKEKVAGTRFGIIHSKRF